MKNKKIGLDIFRIIVSILIIAIHTFPLSSIDGTADFIFTHIICRIGVPFFLMITGFYILPKALDDKNKLIQYTIKTIKIYIICMVLYLPINVYAGDLKNPTFIEIMKDIFVDGTLYHLWYFPALILGIWITYFLIKKFNKKIVIIFVLLLYIIGIFGDSYFGIASKSPMISELYRYIFYISDYTRNGLFYVPIFLSLGYSFNNIKLKINIKNNLILIALSLMLMIVEGLILHHFNLQRHDSMYFMLIPTIFFIFNIILEINKENNKKLRNIATIIYIIHPMFIVLIRGIAKFIHLENLMINNSIIHYILVTICSVVFSIIFENTKKICKRKILNR